jgi:Ca-activated chloride channel family protein
MNEAGYRAVQRFLRVLALAVAALVFCQAWAQKVSTAPTAFPPASASGNRSGTQSPDSIHVQSPLVAAPVTVTDSSGNFVEDLRQEQFHVWDDGVEQQITYFNTATEPVAAVILVQTSKEVAPMLPSIQPLGILLSDLLIGKSGEAAVVTYADQFKAIQNFSSNPETLAASLRTIQAGGSKNARLKDALERAVSMLSNQTRDKRRVVIVFSEGFDRGSVTSGVEVVRAASNANVTIYGIRFNPAGTEFKDSLAHLYMPCPPEDRPCEFAINLTPLAVLAAKTGSRELRRNLLGQYAGYTGGIVYTHWREHSVQDQVRNIALAVNGQYDLAYVPTALNTTGFHTLKITVSDPGFRVRTRAGYFYALPRK